MKMVATCPENSTLQICDLIDEAGTGIGVLTDRIALPLGTFLLILSIVLGVGGLIGALISVIKGHIGGGKRYK